MRLILENSTVCLISRRISLLCPVDIMFACCRLVGGGGVAVSLTMILAGPLLGVPSLVLFSQGMWLLLIVLLAVVLFGWWLVGMFSMESLILAQDERWRRA